LQHAAMGFPAQQGLVTTMLVFSAFFLTQTTSWTSSISVARRRRGFDFVVRPVAPFSQQLTTHQTSSSSLASSVDKRKLIIQDVSASDILETKSKRRRRKWSDMIKKLEKFHRKYGHSFVTSEHDEPELLEWTKLLRNNYRHQVRQNFHHQQVNDKTDNTISNNSRKRHFLSEEKLDALRQINFVWDVQQFLWLRRFDELCMFRAKYGHTDVPIDCSEFPKLGVWLSNQKREYRSLIKEQKRTHDTEKNADNSNGSNTRRSTSLTPGRLEALLSVVDVTRWAEKTHTSVWQKRYGELCDFYDSYGHSNVPQDYSQNFALGQWVMNQRTEYKRYLAGRTTCLDIERIEMLTKVEFCWDSQVYKWYSQLERLKAYQREHGHVNISKKDDENYDLRLWVIRQRQQYNKLLRLQKILEETDELPSLSGKLSPMTHERIKALEEVPEFEWSNSRSYSSPMEGPTNEEWAELFEKIREKGKDAQPLPKKNRFEDDIEKEWTDEEDLMQLWNMEDEDE